MADFILVVQLADAPDTVAGSTFDHACPVCGKRVMIAPSGQRRMRQHPGIRLMCVVCFVEGFEKDPSEYIVAGITADQVAEMKRCMPNYWRKRN